MDVSKLEEEVECRRGLPLEPGKRYGSFGIVQVNLKDRSYVGHLVGYTEHFLCVVSEVQIDCNGLFVSGRRRIDENMKLILLEEVLGFRLL